MTSTHLLAASQLHRPDDQIYPSLAALHAAAKERKNRAVEGEIVRKEVRFRVTEGPDGSRLISLAHPDDRMERPLTPYAYEQVCSHAQMPPNLGLRLRPDTLRSVLDERMEDTNNGGRLQGADRRFQLLTDGERLRAINGARYSRVWDADLVAKLREHGASELKPFGDLAGKMGVGLPPVRPQATGLYGSDRDVFMALLNPDPIEVSGKQVFRGLMAWNSEVGSRTLGVTTFLFDGICGNHIVWGLHEEVRNVKRHVGEMEPVWEAIPMHAAWCLGKVAKRDLARIKAAKQTPFAENDEQALGRLVGMGWQRAVAKRGLDAIEAMIEAEPKKDYTRLSVWGVVAGLTRTSQDTGYATDRFDADRAAGKLLALVDGAQN